MIILINLEICGIYFFRILDLQQYVTGKTGNKSMPISEDQKSLWNPTPDLSLSLCLSHYFFDALKNYLEFLDKNLYSLSIAI